MDLLLNGRVPVLGAEITLPRVGAWVASLHVDTGDEISGAVTLTSADGSLSLRGTVRRGGVYQERGRLEVLGGAGGLSRVLEPRYYRDAPASQVAGDLLRAAGETLSATADSSVLGVALPAWARARGTAGTALAHLLDALGATWRVLADGSVWIGRETWPTVSLPDAEVLDDDPSDGKLVVASDTLPATLTPGVTFLDQRVSVVTHMVGPERVRSVLLLERDGDAGDRLGGPQEAVIRQTMRAVDYHALYPAAVRAQAGDGSLEVAPDSALLPTMTGVPIRLGLPGVTVTVTSAAKVLIGFENGDPRLPVALLWHAEGMTETKLGPAATRGVARLDDAVDAGTLTAVAGATPVTFTYTPAGGGTPVVNTTALLTGGKITSASTKVKSE